MREDDSHYLCFLFSSSFLCALCIISTMTKFRKKKTKKNNLNILFLFPASHPLKVSNLSLSLSPPPPPPPPLSESLSADIIYSCQVLLSLYMFSLPTNNASVIIRKPFKTSVYVSFRLPPPPSPGLLYVDQPGVLEDRLWPPAGQLLRTHTIMSLMWSVTWSLGSRHVCQLRLLFSFYFLRRLSFPNMP